MTAVLVFVVGLAVGRCGAPHGANGPSAESAGTPRTASSRPPTARSRAGAVAAATRAMTALARPELVFDAAALEATVGDVAAPAYRGELFARFDAAYGQVASELGAGDAAHVFMRLVPLAHRVEEFSADRCRVAVWQVLLLGAGDGQVVASWSVSRADLTWSEGRWWVSAFADDEAGPGPAVTSAGTAAPPDLFRARVRDLEGYSR